MKKFFLVFLCVSLFASRLSAQEVDEDGWYNKFLYLGLSFLWIPKIYSDISYNNMASVGVEFTADIRPLRFLSVRAGAEMSQDLMIIHSSEIVTDMIIDFPVAVAYVFSPMQDIMLEPYFGVNYNLSLQRTTNPYPFSWNVGVELALKTGLGIFTIEPRFAMDIGKSSLISPYSKETLEYSRSTLHLGLGYKIGIMDRGVKE